MDYNYNETKGLFNHQETQYYLGSDTTGETDFDEDCFDDEYCELYKYRCTFEEFWAQEFMDF